MLFAHPARGRVKDRVASSKRIPCSWGNDTAQSTHTELRACLTVAASSYVTLVAPVTCELWHLWYVSCGLQTRVSSLPQLCNYAFLGTCPETSAPPIAALPDVTVDKTQYALCTHSSSPFKSQESALQEHSSTRRKRVGPVASQVWHLVCQLLLKGRSPLIWKHSLW